jgi:hypothetical protein
MKMWRFFLRFVCLGLGLAGANCWADVFILIPSVPYANGEFIVGLNNNGLVLGEEVGAFDVGMLWSPPNYSETNWTSISAPWDDFGTHVLGINDAGDVLLFAAPNIADPDQHPYGVYHSADGTYQRDDGTGTIFGNLEPFSTQLSNNRGEYIGYIHDPRAVNDPTAMDTVLFTPNSVPEPSSLLLLGTLAIPALIRFRKRR